MYCYREDTAFCPWKVLRRNDIRFGVPKFPSDLIRVVALMGLSLALPSPGRAQWEPVYRLGQDFAKQLRHDRVGIIGVADPSWAANSNLELPHYLAVSLEAALRDSGKGKDELQILVHQNVHEALTRLHVSVSDIGSPESRKIISDAAFVNVIVYGSLASDATGFRVTFSAESVPEGKILISRDVRFPKTAFTDCLIDTFPPPGDSAIPVPKSENRQHLTVPVCIHCPIPQYNNLARSLKLRGTVVFRVLINVEGRAEDFQLVRLLGYGLDELAIQEIKAWRFRPATLDGKPIRTLVPIEVTFRLY
jgi:TonB family protein